MTNLTLAVPSKGRMMEQATEFFGKSGLTMSKMGDERRYFGEIAEIPGVDVIYTSSSEIAKSLRNGSVHLGITGEDLAREEMADADTRLRFLKKLDFGKADVVVAVPDWWIDVRTVSDLEAACLPFRRAHGRWPRVATKYINIARRFFTTHGFSDYRLIESLGATEGACAAGTAELIVDITSSGETLRANGLRVLDDGVILRSEANLIATNAAAWTPEHEKLRDAIVKHLG